MSNPLRILQTLDKHLEAAAEITLFGRAALALGYPNAPSSFHNTQDVDGILPLAWLNAEDSHDDFWRALQETNQELESDGLYLTHLFRELDVILTPAWIGCRKKLELGLVKLKVYRPATLDLILTKMARGDEEDLRDIRFLLEQEPLTPDELRNAFQSARLPDLPEIPELFLAAQPKVLALVDPNAG